MNKSRVNRASAILYETENLSLALRELARYIIDSMIREYKFDCKGAMECVIHDFMELRTYGVFNPKDILSIELDLLGCILDFVEKGVCRDAVSRENINPFVSAFISEITSLSTIHMIDISNDSITTEEFHKVGLITAFSNSQTESIIYEEVAVLVSKMKEYQKVYNLIHNTEPMSIILN